MKLFVATVLFVVAAVAADRLENTYLPPNSAKTAGGNGNFLNAPRHNQYQHQRQQQQQQTPSNNYGPPSSNYGAPSGGSNFGYSGAQQSQSAEAGAKTLRFDNENNGDGSYRFEYETENQIMHQEAGELKNAGTDQEAQSVQGSYSYMGPDGIMYTVNYIADENGFRATGDHIPTPPPVPEAIQKALDLNAAEEAKQGYDYNQQQSGYNNNFDQSRSGAYNQAGGNGYQNGKQYQQQQQQSRQYLAPNKPSFNQRSGYQY